MRLSADAKHTMLEALDESVAAGAKFGSLHSAYSATGTNELAGGTPAYARRPLTWANAGDPMAGSKRLSGTVVFEVPAGSTVQFFGMWTADTGGTFLGMTPNGGTDPEGFVVYNVGPNVLESPGHPFQNTDAIIIWSVTSAALPTPLVEGTLYYVVNRTTDDYQLALTSGGAAIDITGLGSGFAQRIIPEVFGAAGTHTITSATLSVD